MLLQHVCTKRPPRPVHSLASGDGTFNFIAIHPGNHDLVSIRRDVEDIGMDVIDVSGSKSPRRKHFIARVDPARKGLFHSARVDVKSDGKKSQTMACLFIGPNKLTEEVRLEMEGNRKKKKKMGVFHLGLVIYCEGQRRTRVYVKVKWRPGGLQHNGDNRDCAAVIKSSRLGDRYIDKVY